MVKQLLEMWNFLHVSFLFPFFKEGIRAPIALTLHVNVFDFKLCFVHEMSYQTVPTVRPDFVFMSSVLSLRGKFIQQAVAGSVNSKTGVNKHLV